MHTTTRLLLALLLLAPATSAVAQPAARGAAGALSGTAAAPGVTVQSLFGPSGPPVLVAAHRANSGKWIARALDWKFERTRGPAERAENSLAAIDAAIARGAHILEVDVRVSRDDVPVLMHDDSIKRTTDGKGLVVDKTLAELRAVRLLPKGTIPTLAEAIRRARGRAVLDLDLKTSRMDLVVATIQAENAHDSVILFGNADKLRAARRLDPNLHVMPRAHDLAEARALLTEFQPQVIHIDREDLDSAMVAAAGAAHARLWVNALGPKDVLGCKRFYRKLARDGAGAIQTDKPGKVLAALP